MRRLPRQFYVQLWASYFKHVAGIKVKKVGERRWEWGTDLSISCTETLIVSLKPQLGSITDRFIVQNGRQALSYWLTAHSSPISRFLF